MKHWRNLNKIGVLKFVIRWYVFIKARSLCPFFSPFSHPFSSHFALIADNLLTVSNFVSKRFPGSATRVCTLFLPCAATTCQATIHRITTHQPKSGWCGYSDKPQLNITCRGTCGTMASRKLEETLQKYTEILLWVKNFLQSNQMCSLSISSVSPIICPR